MIISALEADNFINIVYGISPTDPFACRIISLYNSYSPDLVFVDYWLLQNDDEEYTGAIARNGSNFILFLTEQSDIDEVSSFMRVAGASAVICDGKYQLELNGCKTISGTVLVRTTSFEDEENELIFSEPDIKAVYDMIVKSADENFTPPPFDEFYVDVNHKLRHNTARLVGIEEDGICVASAMTVAESGTGAVIGAVSCDPDYRRRGYGSALIKHLTNILVSENKAVYLHRAQNANVDFYKNLGFEEYGTWREYYFVR
ncbi:MAG: GNAT family N-acetyltransferase [Oscillospiraceae bacterium]|nr:GNAT family N-acetyltransferase [Oscillospiraceae bacterium]